MCLYLHFNEQVDFVFVLQREKTFVFKVEWVVGAPVEQ